MEKNIEVVINGVLKVVEKSEYTFEEVIILAFGSFDVENQAYTITVTKKNDNQSKDKEVYVYNDLIKFKEGMRVNVDSTIRS